MKGEKGEHKTEERNLPCIPEVGTSPSNKGCMVLNPGWGARTPYALGPENQNINRKSKTVTNSTDDFKNGPHLKKILIKRYTHTNTKFIQSSNILFTSRIHRMWKHIQAKQMSKYPLSSVERLSKSTLFS